MSISSDTFSEFSREVSSVEVRKESGNRLPWAILLTALISFAALYVTGDRFTGVLVLGGLLLASAFVEWRLPRGALWGWMIRAAMFAVIVANYRLPDRRDIGGWYVDPGVMKLAGLLLAAELTLRVWQRRNARRLAREVLLLTACVMAASAVTYDWGPIHFFAPLYAVAAVLSTRSLAAMGTGNASPKPRNLQWISTGAAAFLLALATGMIAVVVYDKLMYQIDNWAMSMLARTPTASKTIGFSTSHELLASYDPEPSMSRVLLIDGKIFDPHLRIMAFDTYSNRQWRPFEGDRSFEPFAPTAQSPSGGSKVHVQQVEDTGNFLPIPLAAAAVTSDAPLEIDRLASLRVAPENSGTYDLNLKTAPDYQGPLCRAPSDDERQRLLAIPPELDPRVVTLARDVAGAGDNERRVIRIANYLQSHHAYSLNFVPHGEPLNDFILNNRAAHCQYFGSALAIMARAVGVPARYVGGFYAHESRGPDEIVVRERDAHAWTECWIDHVGWITLDATPAASLPDRIYPNPSAWRQWWERILDFPDRLRRWLSALISRGGAALLGTAIVVPLLVILLGAIRRRRHVPVVLPYSNPDTRVARLGRRFESWLTKRGVALPPDRPWTDCITALEHGDSPHRFVRLYNEVRFGGKVQAWDDAVNLLNVLEREQGTGPDARTH